MVRRLLGDNPLPHEMLIRYFLGDRLSVAFVAKDANFEIIVHWICFRNSVCYNGIALYMIQRVSLDWTCWSERKKIMRQFCHPRIWIRRAFPIYLWLTHWGRVTHICVSKFTIIGSDNGLSPGRRQAIIWTNAWVLLIRPIGTNFNEMLIEILTVSFMKMRLKVSSAKWRPFCLGLNVLRVCNDNQLGSSGRQITGSPAVCWIAFSG